MVSVEEAVAITECRLALRTGRPQVSLPEHLAIIDAIARRDPAAAEAAARSHLASVITTLRDSAS